MFLTYSFHFQHLFQLFLSMGPLRGGLFHVLAPLLYYFHSSKNPSTLTVTCVTFSLSPDQFSDFSLMQFKEALYSPPTCNQSSMYSSYSSIEQGHHHHFLHYRQRRHHHQPFFPPLDSIIIH
ncbi:hypothetical protein V8G54_031202 [Vigna mungo]|uniref:Uncharacterized protein n=1 Tax=Vigna mungo TaxID=3915 RepID=A0AAQ3MXQ1_VIGMU